ncbi:MAG: hypothetical protein HKM89_15515 [Gemmatimonadales bacterium]|nr:hypothetical protein [Gemmatimonadales bacterium]
MLTHEEIAVRREVIDRSEDLTALLSRLRSRADAVLTARPPLPEIKALLSVDGGVCPDDGAALLFDPWQQDAHRCSRCGGSVAGERHDAHWARYQHLWLAERMAHLATVGVFATDRAAVDRAHDLLRWYGERYQEFPNRDNVLGPSRLFFSTYLESLWVSNFLAAAFLLREAGVLQDDVEQLVSSVADAAANVIGEYNEGFSNRQTWNDAALAAVAAWFEDEALAGEAIEGPTGLLPHLGQGFGPDGMWYEGENYHLFALRGLLTGASWARLAGVDLGADPLLAERLEAALRAPALTALPDGTFPARKDSRFGLSLAQPMYLELWEIGQAWLAREDADPDRSFTPWLAELYRLPGQEAQVFESYLHEAAESRPTDAPRRRSDLSWWMVIEMAPEFPVPEEDRDRHSVFLEGQGLAVLRQGSRYVSLECGSFTGGHGHPDRLHLTIHADGVLWLPDFGTGSYVAETLGWYRSTLAHNAPRLNGRSQPPGNAVCEAFDTTDDWAWVRGRYESIVRTVVCGPHYILDIVEYAGTDEHLLELPWHFGGTSEQSGGGTWRSGELAGEQVSGVEQLERMSDEPLAIESRVGGAGLRAMFAFDGTILRASAPGIPPRGDKTDFFVLRSTGANIRMVTVLTHAAAGSTARPGKVQSLRVSGDTIEVELESGGGIEQHRATDVGWVVEGTEAVVELHGWREQAPDTRSIIDFQQPHTTYASVPFVPESPLLDGSLEGFDPSSPLELDHEDQYRRSEEPYPGPELFAATSYVSWNGEGLYVAADVRKDELCFRSAEAPPLLLDNEVDGIHSDGIQVYLQQDGEAEVFGLLAVPEETGGDSGPVRVWRIGGADASPDEGHGTWHATPEGYRLTLRVTPPWWESVLGADQLRFDLLVNEMRPGRLRRAGQLVWSGGGGWVWLRGDRQDPRRFGLLELVP